MSSAATITGSVRPNLHLCSMPQLMRSAEVRQVGRFRATARSAVSTPICAYQSSDLIGGERGNLRRSRWPRRWSVVGAVGTTGRVLVVDRRYRFPRTVPHLDVDIRSLPIQRPNDAWWLPVVGKELPGIASLRVFATPKKARFWWLKPTVPISVFESCNFWHWQIGEAGARCCRSDQALVGAADLQSTWLRPAPRSGTCGVVIVKPDAQCCQNLAQFTGPRCRAACESRGCSRRCKTTLAD